VSQPDRIETPEADAHVVDGREPAPDDMLWHRGWIVGMIACGALLLLTAGGVSAQVLLSLAIMAIPGITGAFWRPKAEETFALAALWALGAALAACVAGGLSGPAAVFCILPVLAALTIDYSLRACLGLSAAALAICGLAGMLHLLPPPPAEPARSWLTFAAVLVTACAAGGAALVARRRAAAEREAAQDDVLWFEGLMADLPDLAMTMDAHGRTEAVFGQPFQGFGANALQGGLVAAASTADTARVEAALAAALVEGGSEVAFTPALPLDFRVIAKLHRTGPGGLAAVLRKAPEIVRAPQLMVSPAPAPVPTPVLQPPSDFAEKLAAAEAGRDAAETGRQRAEATAASRALFLANMSHELRTPLNAIMGFSDMMRARMFGELTPKYAEYADLIHESGGHLLDLINDVLDMSKIEAQRYTLSREVFDVREALNAALRLMRLQADDAGVKLRAVLPSEALMVDADKRAIKQMVLNLLSNAVKFTPKGGSVILTAQAAAGVLEIIVGDTGVGIAEDDLKRLGQPFEQAGNADDRARGTGLGLSLVDAFAKLHGGSMSLESRLGEGTAVTVRMPVLVEVAVAEPVPVAPQAELHPEMMGEAEPHAEVDPQVEAAQSAAPVAIEPHAEPEPEMEAEPAAEPETTPEHEAIAETAKAVKPAKPLAPLSTFTPLATILAANDMGAFRAIPLHPQKAESAATPSGPLEQEHPAEAPLAVDQSPKLEPEETPAFEATPEPEPTPELHAEPEPEVGAAPEQPLESQVHMDAETPAASSEAPASTALPDTLGPLHSRTAEHHSLKQSVLSIFSRPAALTPSSEEPPTDPKPDGPRPGNSGITVLG